MPRRCSRIAVAAGLALAAIVAIGACREAADEQPVRARASTLPLWRQPPDKPLGACAARVRGQARSFALRTVARGLRQPVQVVARRGARGRLYVAEQGGRIRVVQGGRVLRRPYLDIRRRVMSGGERGLLTLAFDPRGDHLLVMYSARDGDTRIVRYRAGARAAERSSARTLLRLHQPYENHKGGTLLFDERGRLVAGVGDGGSAFDPEQRAQDKRSPLGKVLRLDPSRPGRGWEVVGRRPAQPVADGLRPPRPGCCGWATWARTASRRSTRSTSPRRASGCPTWAGRPTRATCRWVASGCAAAIRSYGRSPATAIATGAARSPAATCIAAGATARCAAATCTATSAAGRCGRSTARGAGDRRALDLRREAARVPGLVSFGEDLDGELYAVSAQGTVARLVGARPPDTRARSSLRMP